MKKDNFEDLLEMQIYNWIQYFEKITDDCSELDRAQKAIIELSEKLIEYQKEKSKYIIVVAEGAKVDHNFVEQLAKNLQEKRDSSFN